MSGEVRRKKWGEEHMSRELSGTWPRLLEWQLLRRMVTAQGSTESDQCKVTKRFYWHAPTSIMFRTVFFVVVFFFKSNSLSVSSNPSEAFQTQIYMSYHVWFYVSWHKYSLLLKLIHLTKQQTDLISPMMLHAWPQIVLQKGNLIFITITYVQGLW